VAGCEEEQGGEDDRAAHGSVRCPGVAAAAHAGCVGATSTLGRGLAGGPRALRRPQTEVLFAFQLTGPQERKTIQGWIADKGLDEDIAGELPKLTVGHPHVWSPAWLKVSRVVAIGRKTTFDASSTPVLGKASTARVLSPIDLAQLRTEMAATIERAKAEDPRELRRQVAELKAQLAKHGVAKPVAAAPPKRVEIPVLTADQVKRLEAAIRKADAAIARLGTVKDGAQEAINTIVAAAKPIAEGLKALRVGPWMPATSPNPARIAVHVAPTARPETVRALGTMARAAIAGAVEKMSGAERKILTALAQHESRTKVQVAILAGYAHSGGGFNNALSACRTKGWLDGRGEQLRITDAGVVRLGPVEALPTGRALVDYWLGQLAKAERAILRQLVDVYPAELSKPELGERTGYESDGGGFNNALSRLRTLELIEGRGEVRASAELVG
jgi:hypothetical protein